MKITVLQEDLLQGLTIVSRFISSRAQLPVLANVLISTDKNKIRLAATNLEMGISLYIGAKIEKEGSITVPAKVILELVFNLPAGQIIIENKQDQLQIKTSSFSANLGSIPASEFPSIPGQIKDKRLSLSTEDIEQINKKVSFSSSKDETRPTLTGILFTFEEGKIKAIATDGFRLSLKEISTKVSKQEKLLIPAKTVDELSRIVGGKPGEIDVSIMEREKQVLFSVNSILLSGRFLEGDFPNYEKIIPREWNHMARVNREEFARAIRAAGVIARDSAGVIRVNIKKDGLSVLAENQQYGSEETTVDAKVEGEEIEIAFNYKYILEFLGSVMNEEISLETAGNTSPAVFRDTKDPSYFHLIMPIKI